MIGFVASVQQTQDMRQFGIQEINKIRQIWGALSIEHVFLSDREMMQIWRATQ